MTEKISKSTVKELEKSLKSYALIDRSPHAIIDPSGLKKVQKPKKERRPLDPIDRLRELMRK